ncbi:MAG: pyrimidine dimer DNA glycosylase/endonuclease V [archaeon]|jgi:hypothetical protein
MRLWSLHPKYLDTKGLVALWREALLAKAVLENKTKGYKNHPQLERFKKHKNPIKAINSYLSYVLEEAKTRGYKFDESKIDFNKASKEIEVNSDQLKYEFEHLIKKLKIRDNQKYKEIKETKIIQPHPLVKIKKGKIENWEKTNPN